MAVPGRPPKVRDEDILAVFLERDDRVLWTGEVADELPIRQDSLSTRLNDLEERGLLASKKRHKMAVWWLSDKGRQHLSDR